jgi:hypothetical protein
MGTMQLIQNNIFMVTGCPEKSGWRYNFEEDRFTIRVNEHDNPGMCLPYGLAEIKRRGYYV